MSKVVDERVVEMRFDNRQFESNVQTSLSTLDKLKQKLNLSGASKGLENLNAAAGKVDMRGLGSAVDTVTARFSALEVMGVTALANITNSAVNAGKRIVSALTIDPVKTGFSEYETQINSVQTILANTQHAGTTLEQVTAALDELNKYADKTIYNFTEMTRNIGTFTAAGVDLETSVTAIQGIANLAAVSGSTSQQASVAMYQLSQALASGTVKLMDWNSVVNAGMGGKVFQDALMETARIHGVAIDEMVKNNGSFRETLREEWLTSEILTETLEKFTMATEGATDAEIAANREKLKGLGYTEEQIEAIFKLGNTATSAATKVKTFTQWWDVMKESAQSGWAKTWQILIGDFEEAKTLWSSIAEVTTGVINKMSDSRNNLLENVFGGASENWPKLIKMVNEAGVSADDFKEKLIEVGKKHGKITDDMVSSESKFNASLEKGWVTRELVVEALNGMLEGNKGVSESTEDMTAKLKKFQQVVDDVWQGDYKNGQARVEALTKAGYDYAEVQELVNKTVDGHKLKLEDLSDAQLKAVGYTDEQIEAINKLKAEAENADTSLSKLIERMSRPSGRTLLFDSFKNFGSEFKKIIDAVKEAWNNVFGEIDAEEMLYNLIENLHELSEAFKISEGSAENFKYICEGIFSLFQLGTSIVSMSVVGGLKILAAILEVCGTNLLELGGAIGKAIISFRDWVKENTLLIGTWQKIGEFLGAIVDGVAKCAKAFWELEKVQEVVQKVKDAVKEFFDQFDIGLDGGLIDGVIKKIEAFFDKIEEAIKKLPTSDAFQAGLDIVAGLAEGIKSGASAAIDAIIDIGKRIITAICNVLGIESPSKVMIAIGAFIIMGLVEGILSGENGLIKALGSMFKNVLDTVIEFLQNGLPYAFEVVKGFLVNIGETIKNGDIDWSALFIAGTIAVAIFMFHKLLNILEKVANPLEKLGGVFGTLKDAIKDIAKAKKMEIYSVAIRNIAISLGILAASVFILAQCDWKKLLAGVIAIAAIAGVLTLLVWSINKMKLNELEGVASIASISLFLISMGVSLIMVAKAAEKIASISTEGIGNCAAFLLSLAILISGILIVSKYALQGNAGVGMMKLAGMLIGISVALLIMSKALESLGTMDDGVLRKGIGFIFLLMSFMAALTLISKYSGFGASGAGSMLLKMAIAIGILVLVIKAIANIPFEDVLYGMGVIAAISLLFKALIKVSADAGPHASKAGTMFLKMAVAIGVLALAMKLISTMSMNDIVKGLFMIAGVEALFMAFIDIADHVGPNVDKAGTMFFKMGLAIGVLAVAIRLIAGVSVGDILKGIATIATLMLLFAGVVKCSEYAGKHADRAGAMLFKMSLAILILVGAIAILSLLKPEDVAVGTLAISMILGAFALLVKMTKYSKHANNLMKTLIVMAVCIGILGGVLITLSCLDPKGVLTATVAISSMLGMFALLLYASKFATKISPSMLIMVGVIAALAFVLYMVADLPIASSMGAAAALSILLISMTAALTILSFIGPKAFIGAGALAALVGVMALLALVLNMMKKLDVIPSMETAKALSILLLGMSAACVILGVVGMMGPSAIVGALSMIGVISVLGIFIAAVGKLAQKIPELESFLDSGIPIIEKIGYAIGSFFGNILGGFASGLTSGLPDIANDMSEFMTSLQPFIDGAKSIDEGIVDNIRSLSTAILTLTAADVLNGLSAFLPGGGTSFSEFGTELAAFGESLVEFSNTTAGIDQDSLDVAVGATESLVELSSKISDNVGLFEAITGVTDMATWGDNLSAFAEGLVEYSNVISQSDINADAIKASAEAAKGLVELSSSISEDVGLFQAMTGITDMGTWSNNLKTFAQGLVDYSNTISQGEINSEAIDTSVKAANGLVKLSQKISDNVGFFEAMTGITDMGTWGNNLKTFAQGLVEYSKAVAGDGSINLESINTSIVAATALVKLSGIIGADTGWFERITGITDMSTFGTNLSKFGECMQSYSDSVADLNVENITASISAAKALVKVANSVPKDGKGQNDLKEFGKTAVSFAEKLADYSSELEDVDLSAVNKSASATKKLVEAINSTANVNASGVGTFKTALSDLASTNLKGFVSTFSGAASQLTGVGSNMINSLTAGLNAGKGRLSSAASSITSSLVKSFNNAAKSLTKSGNQMASNLAKGLKAKASTVKSAASNVSKQAATGARGGYNSFYNAGYYLVQGFARGIKDSSYLAVRAAQYAANQAKIAIDKQLEINSPAKVMIPSGSAVVEGLAKGIYDNLSYVKDAGVTAANYARDTISASISKIADVINMDIDSEPTIRPVVDLSDVEAGASRIGELMNVGSSVGVLTNIGRINSMMNRRNQNGVNDDVISAIDKLGDKLGNLGNTYNSIGGVSYNDGSDVGDAIKTIVRAAIMERRV